MREVAGAIVVLAGAVASGAGVIANAVWAASNRPADATTGGCLIGGFIVVIIGFGLLFIAPRGERRP
jgi:hypothetical protein